jgi:pimeloyl-ACP methyl ester carboxylesterase
VLRYDLRGHGWSQKGLAGTYTMATCVDDLQGVIEAVVKPVRGDGKVTLYGHSMGGTVAFMHAMRFPSAVERLLLVAPWLKVTATPDIIDGFNALLASYARKFEREFGRKKGEQAKLGLQFFPHWNDSSLLPEQQATVELGKDMMEYKEDIDALSSITVPTHVFIGDADRPDLKAAAKLVHEKIPGSTLDVVAGGHNLAIEARDTFPAMVARYVRS